MSVKEQINSNDNIKEHPLPWNLLADHHGIKIDPKLILKLTKGAENVSNEDKENCEVLHLTTECDFEELLNLLNELNPQEYPNLFVVIIEGSSLELLDENSEISKKIKKSVLKFGAEHPLVLQLTSMDENLSKVYYQKEVSSQFLAIGQQEENIAEVKDFSFLLRSFLDGKIKNLDQVTAAWQYILKSPLFMKFLKLFKNLFFKLILEITKSGTKAELLTILEAPAKHEGRVLSIEAQNYLTKLLYEKQPRNEPIDRNESDEDDLEVENESQTSSSILLTAIKHKKAEVIEYLITYWTHLIQELPPVHQFEISTTAYQTDQFDVLCDLLEIADFPFPEDYELGDGNERLQKLAIERVNFASAIKKEDFTKIDKFIDNNPSLKQVLSIDNESALAQAVKEKKFGAFYYLKSLGFQGEDCEEVLIGLEKEDRQKAAQQAVKQRKANIKGALVNVHKSVMLLATRSLIHNRRIKKEQEAEYRQKIMNWLQDIHKVAPEMFDVAASCEYLKIIFDFESHTVENASLAGPNAVGSAYPIRKWIFVGAQLSDKKREQRIKGVLAHELCHYVMRLVYENQENPYYKDRVDIKEIFEEIVKTIDKWSAVEETEHPDDECNGTISSVFTRYKIEEFHLELIVRVVQILSEFDDNEEKTRGLEEKYQDLFNFWYDHVVPELQLYLQKNQQVGKLNGFVGLLPKILKHKIEVKTSKINEEVTANKLAVITTNIPMLLFVDICNFLKKRDGILMDSKNFFIEPEKLNNLEIWNEFKQVCRDVDELSIFVDCTKGVPDSLGNIFVNKELNFIFITSNVVQCEELIKIFSKKEMKNATKMEINYNWNDLKEESQKSLLDIKINFQNNSETLLKELFLAKLNPESESLNPGTDTMPDLSEVIEEDFLNLIIDGENLTINSVKDQDQNEKYFKFIKIQREFLKKIRQRDIVPVYNRESETSIQESMQGGYFNGFVPDEIDGDDVSVRQNEVKSAIKDKNEYIIEESIISQEKLLSEIKNQPFVLISDKAGNGKSWAMKNFTKIHREENPTSWVTYVDLKQFIKEFKAQEDQEIMPEFSLFMAEKILRTEQKFELKIFQKLYNDGKVFILFDGFDEIAPNCAEFVSNLAQSFQSNGGNQLWIATRDYFEVDLIKKLNIDVAYGLEEMSDNQGVELIARSWILMDLGDKKEDTSREKFEQHVERSSKFKNYKEKAWQIVKKVKVKWNRSVGMPQMYKMIADAYKNEQNVEELKESKIFEKFIKTCYRRWSDEKGQLRKKASIESQNLKFNFWKFHQCQAIASKFPALAKILFPGYNEKGWPVEEVIACGILSTKNGEFYFIHETLREYFAADALAKALGSEEINDKIVEVFVDVLTLRQYKIIRMFLNDFVDSTNLLKIQPKMKDFIEKFNKMETFAEFFTENLENLVDFVLLILKDGDYKFVKYTLKRRSKEIIKNTKNSKIFFKFQDFLCQFLTANDLKDLIKSEEIFKAIIRSELIIEVFDNFVLKVEGKAGHEFVQKELRKVIIKEWMQNRYLNYFFEAIDPEAFKFKKFILLLQKFLLPTEVQEFLKTDENILLFCDGKENKEILKILWTVIENYFARQNMSRNFRACLMQKNEYKRNILHKIAKSDNLEIHKIFWELLLNTFKNHRKELKYFVLQKNEFGNNFVHELVIRNKNPEIIEWTFKMLKENFNDFQFQNIIQSKGGENRNLIHSTADGGQNIETFKLLWDLFRSSFKSEQEFWKFMKEVDDDGRNVPNCAAQNSPVEVFNFLIDEFEKNYPKEEIKKMLSKSDKWNQSLLHCAALNESAVNFKAVWRNLKKYLKSDEILEIAKQVDSEDLEIFLFYVESSETFEFAIEELEKIESRDEIRSLLSSMNKKNQNILQNGAYWKSSLKLHETLWKILRKYFENSEIKNFIKNVDKYENNLLHLAVSRIAEKEVIELTWNEIKTFLNRDEQIEFLKMKGKYGENLIELVKPWGSDIKDWMENLIEEYKIEF